MKLDYLFKKYPQNIPRYTSYPPLPRWDNSIDEGNWQDKVIEDLGERESIDLYIHIPYCKQLCYYCGCHRIIKKNPDHGARYLNLVLKEWFLYQKILPSLKIKSIHFGGGSPTFLTARDLSNFLETLSPFFSENLLGAIELDPRYTTPEFLDVLRKFQFRRFSLGVQDFDPEVQKAINRIQPFKLVASVVELIRQKFSGPSINFDLIYGLPKQTIETISNTIDLVIKLRPSLLAFYQYAHMPGLLKNQKLIDPKLVPNPSEKGQLFLAGKNLLAKIGYIPIGLDHFAYSDSFLAKAYQEKKLTRNFMGHTDYKTDFLLGLGVSSISQTHNYYAQNEKNLNVYSNLLKENKLPIVKGHSLTCREKSIQNKINQLLCYHEMPADHQNEWQEFVEEKLLTLKKERNTLAVTDIGQLFLRNMANKIDQNYSS